MYFFVIFVVLGVLSANNVRAQNDSSLPSDFPVCKRSDPNLNQCFHSLLAEWTIIFRDGIESLNVHSTDPLKLGRANFVYDNGFLKGVVSLKRLVLVGISALEVRNVSIKLNGTDVTLDEEFFIPKLRITAKYRGEFTMLGINLRPNGNLDVALTNVTLFGLYKAHTFDRENGYTYVQIDTLRNRAAIDHMDVNMTGLSTDKITNDAVVEFINKNGKQIFDAVSADTLNIWDPYMLERFNKFCAQVPLLVD